MTINISMSNGGDSDAMDKATAPPGRAFLISGSVGARPPPLRGSGPLD